MAARLFGAHMPTVGGLDRAVRNGRAIGCTAVQVFTSSPQQWRAKEVTPDSVSRLAEACTETGIGSHVVSHDSYLINLCAPDPEIRAKSIAGLTGELRRCAELQIPFVVSHMGAAMGQPKDDALRIVAEETTRILAETPDTVTLLMETTAGQGSALNDRFEDLARILELTERPARLGVCVDTCHIFAAGYDIRTEEGYHAVWSEFDRLVGLDRVKAIHCNDSKKELGSRVDRHAHLGDGCIGETAFRLLARDPRFFQTPILLETPEAETMHAVNLARLWEWSGETPPTA